MKERRGALALAVLASALFAAGCATKVEYGDPDAVETLTVDFGSTDLQMIAETMVRSMLASPVIQQRTRPVVQVSGVRNRTNEHIDTQAITDKIRTTLIQSGQVRFSAAEVREEMLRELEFQRGSGYVNPETRKQVGRQVGADYLLTGEITSIAKQRGKVRDVYYKITLNLVNLESGLIDWADEKEIRKGER